MNLEASLEVPVVAHLCQEAEAPVAVVAIVIQIIHQADLFRGLFLHRHARGQFAVLYQAMFLWHIFVTNVLDATYVYIYHCSYLAILWISYALMPFLEKCYNSHLASTHRCTHKYFLVCGLSRYIFCLLTILNPSFQHLVGQVISIPSDPRDPSNSHKNMFHTFVIIVPAYSGGTIRSMIRSFFVER